MRATVSCLLMPQKYNSSKKKDSKIKNIFLSGDFPANNMIKAGLNGYVY